MFEEQTSLFTKKRGEDLIIFKQNDDNYNSSIKSSHDITDYVISYLRLLEKLILMLLNTKEKATNVTKLNYCYCYFNTIKWNLELKNQLKNDFLLKIARSIIYRIQNCLSLLKLWKCDKHNNNNSRDTKSSSKKLKWRLNCKPIFRDSINSNYDQIENISRHIDMFYKDAVNSEEKINLSNYEIQSTIDEIYHQTKTVINENHSLDEDDIFLNIPSNLLNEKHYTTASNNCHHVGQEDLSPIKIADCKTDKRTAEKPSDLYCKSDKNIIYHNRQHHQHNHLHYRNNIDDHLTCSQSASFDNTSTNDNLDFFSTEAIYSNYGGYNSNKNPFDSQENLWQHIIDEDNCKVNGDNIDHFTKTFEQLLKNNFDFNVNLFTNKLNVADILINNQKMTVLDNDEDEDEGFFEEKKSDISEPKLLSYWGDCDCSNSSNNSKTTMLNSTSTNSTKSCTHNILTIATDPSYTIVGNGNSTSYCANNSKIKKNRKKKNKTFKTNNNITTNTIVNSTTNRLALNPSRHTSSELFNQISTASNTSLTPASIAAMSSTAELSINIPNCDDSIALDITTDHHRGDVHIDADAANVITVVDVVQPTSIDEILLANNHDDNGSDSDGGTELLKSVNDALNRFTDIVQNSVCQANEEIVRKHKTLPINLSSPSSSPSSTVALNKSCSINNITLNKEEFIPNCINHTSNSYPAKIKLSQSHKISTVNCTYPIKLPSLELLQFPEDNSHMKFSKLSIPKSSNSTNNMIPVCSPVICASNHKAQKSCFNIQPTNSESLLFTTSWSTTTSSIPSTTSAVSSVAAIASSSAIPASNGNFTMGTTSSGNSISPQFMGSLAVALSQSNNSPVQWQNSPHHINNQIYCIKTNKPNEDKSSYELATSNYSSSQKWFGNSLNPLIHSNGFLYSPNITTQQQQQQQQHNLQYKQNITKLITPTHLTIPISNLPHTFVHMHQLYHQLHHQLQIQQASYNKQHHQQQQQQQQQQHLTNISDSNDIIYSNRKQNSTKQQNLLQPNSNNFNSSIDLTVVSSQNLRPALISSSSSSTLNNDQISKEKKLEKSEYPLNKASYENELSITNQIKSSNSNNNQLSNVPSTTCCVSGMLDQIHFHGSSTHIAFKSSLPNLDKSQRACCFYMRGGCKKEDCEYAHDLSKVICKFWEKGDCFKADTCPFKHGYFKD